MPSWLTRGRTSWLQKDESKGNVASNYRPLTCLPYMRKLLTGGTADQIYAYLDQKKLSPEEQKECRKSCRGTNDLLYLDREVIKEVKSRNKEFSNGLDRLKENRWCSSTFVDYRMFRFVWKSTEY